jgi:hypothetical protein
MTNRLSHAVLQVTLVIGILVMALATGASAQSVIPPQISGYLCQNFGGIKTVTGPAALVIFAGTLIFGMIRRHANLVVDLIVGGFIALFIFNLPTILASVGITTGC